MWLERRGSTENCARDWILTILPPNGTCTNQNPSWRMKHKILRFSNPKRSFNPGQKTRSSDNKQKKKKLCCVVDSVIPIDQRENHRKQNERQVFGPCQRTKKTVEYKSDSDTNRNNLQRVGNWRTNQVQPKL